MTRKNNPSPADRIVTCGREAVLGAPVIRWDQPGGWACPHPRGRSACTQHDPALNEAPTRPLKRYRIEDPESAYRELTRTVHQLVLHYDVCFTSWQCHQLLQDSTCKGSHFYLDLDGTVYQTCDLYWKTNTAPADDRRGNERAVHVEMANLSWQARAEESDLYGLKQDAYICSRGRWRLNLPEPYRRRLRDPAYIPAPARHHKTRGYFSRRINGRLVRMWDFTEAQYRSLIELCRGVHQLLPRIRLQVPFNPRTHRTPLDRLPDFDRFEGILGHAHVQAGRVDGVRCKYDPGSAFDWGRLRRAFSRLSPQNPK